MVFSIFSIIFIRSVCDLILVGKICVIDVGCCNECIMILLVGVGYEVEIIERVDWEVKNCWGVLVYMMVGWR